MESQSNNNNNAYYQFVRSVINYKIGQDTVKNEFRKIGDIVIAMGNMNFSKRLKVSNSKDLFTLLACNLNIVNEELEQKAISKDFLEKIVERVMVFKPDLALLTNMEGKIKHYIKNPKSEIRCTKEELLESRVQNFISTHIHFTIGELNMPNVTEINMSGITTPTVNAYLQQTEVMSMFGEVYFLYMFKEKKESL